jgi:gluconolactonase
VVDDPALILKAWKGDDDKMMYKFRMAWYRIQVTIPEKVAGKDVAGTAVWFRTTVDDYAEVWVNGKIDTGYGRGAIAGFNTPNEVKLTDSAKPGETIQIAVLAINSPWGNPPANWIFFRNPTELRFFKK